MKKQRKPTKAQRELAAEWEAIQRKWENVPKFATMPKGPERQQAKLEAYREAYSAPIPSLVTPGGSTAPAKSMTYTGTELVGIATMHKSNLIPVFSRDEAKDTAGMRRG